MSYGADDALELAMRYLWLAALATALGLGAPAAAGAAVAATEWGSLAGLATGRVAQAPAGWLNYCMADLATCLQTSEVMLAEPTAELLALVDRVQREVNARVQPRAEPPGRDLWQVAVGSGDCEDYALAKQAELRAAGVPAAATRLVTARIASGEMHAVLAHPLLVRGHHPADRDLLVHGQALQAAHQPINLLQRREPDLQEQRVERHALNVVDHQ